MPRRYSCLNQISEMNQMCWVMLLCHVGFDEMRKMHRLANIPLSCVNSVRNVSFGFCHKLSHGIQGVSEKANSGIHSVLVGFVFVCVCLSNQ